MNSFSNITLKEQIRTTTNLFIMNQAFSSQPTTNRKRSDDCSGLNLLEQPKPASSGASLKKGFLQRVVFVKYTFVIMLFFITLPVIKAQVGIGTTDPDTVVILDIKSESKGVMLPRINNLTILGIEGALFYAPDSAKFKYYHNNEWLSVNPLKNDIKDNVIAPGTLKVNGANVYAPNADSISARKATVTADNFVGYGTIPLGGIIMWSGTTLPEGWALCNGKSKNGYTTPDLSGRFIVSYDSSSLEYNNPGNLSNKLTAAGKTGGLDSVSLDITQIPPHDHDVIDNGHNHSITGQYMQKSGMTTLTVVALDASEDESHGNMTYTDKIEKSTANITLRKTGGVYTYENFTNSNYIDGCTVWHYNCKTSGGVTFNSNYNMPAYGSSRTYISTSSTPIALSWAPSVNGYTLCDNVNSAICGYPITDTYFSSYVTISTCTVNSGYDPSHLNCVPDHYNPNLPLGTQIRINEQWTPAKPFNNRPRYYVLAFIMRVK
jgi:microcystin-dependent protein